MKQKNLLISLYPTWEEILVDLSELFSFEFKQVYQDFNSFGKLQNRYVIYSISYARKADLDNYIINGKAGSSESARASVLYSLYACSYLVVTDIEYPTYKDWKAKHGLSLDHNLPKYWFPRWTFDCDNWKPLSIQENQHKGDDFLIEGLEKLESLSSELKNIKSKYI